METEKNSHKLPPDGHLVTSGFFMPNFALANKLQEQAQPRHLPRRQLLALAGTEQEVLLCVLDA